MRDGINIFICILIIIGCLFLLAGCGSGDSVPPQGNGSGEDPPPMAINSIALTCLDVDNDRTCEAQLEASGIFNSGAVKISGSPMPADYLNLEMKSTLEARASVFLYSMISISGCGDQPLAFDAVNIEPGETVSYSEALWGFRCGSPDFNELVMTIYNAAHFNPWDYPSAYVYPRDQAIANAVVRWQNTGSGG